MQQSQISGSLHAAETQSLLATMSLFPGGAPIPLAVVSMIHKRYVLHCLSHSYFNCNPSVLYEITCSKA